MNRLWIRVVKKHRIVRQTTVPCDWGGEQEALCQALRDLDLPMPLWLDKHEKEFQSFRHTVFLPDHFIEDVPMDRLEIEFLDDSDAARRSRDPRNTFD